MRVIIDTNVLIPGIFFGGLPAKILKAWHGDELQLIVSPESRLPRFMWRNTCLDNNNIYVIIIRR